VFSTSLPEHSVALIKSSYEIFPSMKEERLLLGKLVSQFQATPIRFEKLPSATPIQIVMIPGNEEAKKVAIQLQEHNLDVRAILYPTVPKGKERLRIVLHAFNKQEEVAELTNLLGNSE
jgi:8-amino-7-oxononanoate synthase